VSQPDGVYVPERGAFADYEQIRENLSDDKFITYIDEYFHIGQEYDDTPARKLACVQCGGKQFEVAEGHCFTAIRCPKCGWELRIHEG